MTITFTRIACVATSARAISRFGGWLCGALCVLLLSTGYPSAHETSDLYSKGPVPSWVLLHTPREPQQANRENSSDGLQYLAVDRQYKEYGEHAYYFRYVYRVENVTGRSDSSDISIYIDPAFEHVTLHDVSIQRNGDRLDRLADADIAVLHQETELEKQIYDGGRTLHILLNDVRVGDVIDYSYTTVGKNPLFKDSVNLTSTVQWSVPTAFRRLRLLIPRGKELWSKPFVRREKPAIKQHADHTEYVWQANDLEGLDGEKGVPAWFPVYPFIQATTFGTWEDVVAEELKIYDVPRPLPAELEPVVAKIMSDHGEPAERMVAALRYVQDEIRYVAIHIGTGGYVPNSPEKTLMRRYGDCKDKTFLLLAMLDRMGVEGYPVLVHSDEGRALDQYLPSRGLFDHMIAQAQIGSTTYWLDGTLSHQKGDADHLYQPDYGKVLVVREGTNGLVEMASEKPQKPKVEVKALIDASGGPASDIYLTVETLLRGPRAAYTRSWLDRDLEDGVQETYLKYFKDYYDAIEVSDPIEFKFDDAVDELRISESYVIKDGWHKEEDEWYFAVINEDFHENLSLPKDSIRQHPFELSHPIWQVHANTIRLPGEDWTREYKADHYKLENDHLFVTADQTINGNEIHVVREYKSLKDHVVPADLKDYVRDTEEAQNYTESRYLYFPVTLTDGTVSVEGTDAPSDRLSLLFMLATVGGVTLAIAGGTRLHTRRALREDGARMITYHIEPVSETFKFKGNPAQVWRALSTLSFLEGTLRIRAPEDTASWDASSSAEGAQFEWTYARKSGRPLVARGTITNFVPQQEMTVFLEPHSLYSDQAIKNYKTASELTIHQSVHGNEITLTLTDERAYALNEKLAFFVTNERSYLRKFLRRSARNVRTLAKRMG